MAKYFYTDALKMMWMAREHGIRYSQDKDYLTKYTFQPKVHIFTSQREDKYCIHSDCHEAFKPQDGDLVEWNDKVHYSGEQNEGVGYCDIPDCPSFPNAISFSDNRTLREPESFAILHIIQRNGKAFFMPEIE